MGPTACFVLATLSLVAVPPYAGGEPPERDRPSLESRVAARASHFDVSGVRYRHLDPRVIAVTREFELELELIGLAGSPRSPLEVVVSGAGAGRPPLELARHRFDGPPSSERRIAVRLPRAGLGAFDELVVSWTRPFLDGTSEGGLLARVAAAPAPGEELVLGGGTWNAGEPEPHGYFLTFHCPEEEGGGGAEGATTAGGKKGCTVTFGYISPANGKLTEGEKQLAPGESVSISALLVLYASCEGCS